MSIKLKDTIYDLINNSNFSKQLNTARSIWGQSFDGTGNVSGNIYGGQRSFTVYGYNSTSASNVNILTHDNNKSLWLGYGMNADGNSTIIAGTSIEFRFGTSRGFAAFINSSGNVGIGTISPAYKLDVNGSLNATTIYQNGTPINSLLGGNYLPLSGGQIDGALIINRDPSVIFFKRNGTTLGSIGFNGDLNPIIYNAASNTAYKLWHEGNDGSSSGLDADLLDGIHAVNFMRKMGFVTNANTSLLSGSYRFQETLTGLPSGATSYGTMLTVSGGDTYDTLWQMYGNYNNNNLYYRRGNWSGLASNDWKQIAFIDSNVASADYASNAGLLDGIESSYYFKGIYNASLNFNSFADGSNDNNFYYVHSGLSQSNRPPFNYGGLLNLGIDTMNAQIGIASQGVDGLYVRTRWWSSNGGTWRAWKQIAFTDSNVASATNARYVIADNNAKDPGYALLQSGSGRADASPSGDTWIYYDSLGGTSTPWGIKHEQASNLISFYGGGTRRAYIDLSNGNISCSTINGYTPITSGNIGSQSVNYATSAGSASSAIKASQDSDGNTIKTTYLRKVTVANNTKNDFNTFENMTLTGRGDPTTGASLSNAPWQGSGPAGGYGVLTYLWSGYGTQMAWGYNSNRIYIRNKYYSGGAATWSSTWSSIALTSDIPTSLPANGGNADTVDGYHASSLWRSNGGIWNPNANITLTPTANGQEWSFDMSRGSYTGCYWHVWENTLGSCLKVEADNGKVTATYTFNCGTLQIGGETITFIT